MKRKQLAVLVAVVLVVSLGLLVWQRLPKPAVFLPLLSPPPKTVEDIFPYQIPALPKQRAYRLVLVGDSMTRQLGINANPLREKLIERYPQNEFVNYNYGFSATNILSLPERLHTQTTFLAETYPPILQQGFEIIIIESFANNPLSSLPLEEGLRQHNATLDKAIVDIVNARPTAVVALLVTVAPSNTHFGLGVVDLSSIERERWAKERTAYIKNHIDYANARSLPLINVYEKSLTPQGDGDLRFISKTDYIHPSDEGVELIAQTIADFIYQNQLFLSQ